MIFRIFKESALYNEKRTVSSLNDAAAIYRQYFADGYAVRVNELETGIEYSMRDEKLQPIPYSTTFNRSHETEQISSGFRLAPGPVREGYSS